MKVATLTRKCCSRGEIKCARTPPDRTTNALSAAACSVQLCRTTCPLMHLWGVWCFRACGRYASNQHSPIIPWGTTWSLPLLAKPPDTHVHTWDQKHAWVPGMDAMRPRVHGAFCHPNLRYADIVTSYWRVLFVISTSNASVGRDSAVGMATSYRLDGLNTICEDVSIKGKTFISKSMFYQWLFQVQDPNKSHLKRNMLISLTLQIIFTYTKCNLSWSSKSDM